MSVTQIACPSRSRETLVNSAAETREGLPRYSETMAVSLYVVLDLVLSDTPDLRSAHKISPDRYN